MSAPRGREEGTTTMLDRPESVTYIARAKCGCMHVVLTAYVGVRVPDRWMRDLTDAIADGCTLETVSTQEVRDHFSSRCDVCDPPKPVQETLL